MFALISYLIDHLIEFHEQGNLICQKTGKLDFLGQVGRQHFVTIAKVFHAKLGFFSLFGHTTHRPGCGLGVDFL